MPVEKETQSSKEKQEKMPCTCCVFSTQTQTIFGPFIPSTGAKQKGKKSNPSSNGKKRRIKGKAFVMVRNKSCKGKTKAETSFEKSYKHIPTVLAHNSLVPTHNPKPTVADYRI